MGKINQGHYYNEHDENQVKKILKEKKKRRLKKKIKIFLFLVIIVCVGYYFYSDYSKVKTIQVQGNDEVSSETILNNVSLTKKDYYLFIKKAKIVDEVKSVGMIKKASVSVDLFGNVVIHVEEAEKVAYCEINKKIYVIDELGNVSEAKDKKVVETIKVCPRLSKFKNTKLLKQFAKEYIKIPDMIKSQTSDIVYSPKKADETRLEFIMDNGKILCLRIEDMAEQLKNFPYEAYMSTYKDKCVFKFEGKNLYMDSCE